MHRQRHQARIQTHDSEPPATFDYNAKHFGRAVYSVRLTMWQDYLALLREQTRRLFSSPFFLPTDAHTAAVGG